jgi:hypothetical protein
LVIPFIARAVGVEEHLPLLLVGFAESSDGGGRAFHFQCDLRVNQFPEISNWPEGESYCVSNEAGLTRFGCVSDIEYREGALKVLFTEGAVRDLRLEDSAYEIQLAGEGFDLNEVLRELRRILTCGRPEYHPRFVGM